MNEAYVPLPDGRTIPVTLSTDGMSGGGNVLSPVSIEINVHSDGSTTESGDTESIWNNAAQRMKAIALETIAQEKRLADHSTQTLNVTNYRLPRPGQSHKDVRWKDKRLIGIQITNLKKA